MSGVVISIPGDPVAKGRPRFTRKGFAYTPAKTRAAERSIAQCAAEVMIGRRLFDEPLAVVVDCAFIWPKTTPRRRMADPHGIWREKRPDVENLAKTILDAFNHVVWTDDGLVALAFIRKFYSERPGVTVTVCPIREFRFESTSPLPVPRLTLEAA